MDTRIKWNKKHAERLEEHKRLSPNPRLKDLSPYLNGGMALDLACGLGGNSLFLAEKNYQVLALDISDIAVKHLQNLAEEQKLDISPQVRDLTEPSELNLPDHFFNLAVITYYLDRALFPVVKKVIQDHGYFFMETFYRSSNHNEGISNRYKLQPKELLSEFADWKILFFEENEQEGRQTIFCQKC